MEIHSRSIGCIYAPCVRDIRYGHFYFIISLGYLGDGQTKNKERSVLFLHHYLMMACFLNDGTLESFPTATRFPSSPVGHFHVRFGRAL
jgi:hypothetical protein